MDAFGIEDGPGGAGSGRYAAGLIGLPGGLAYGVEAVTRIAVEDGADAAARAGLVAGSFRDALGSAHNAPLPLRLALSTMRAGLSVVEEGLRPRAGLRVEIAFEDGSVIRALMSAETVAAIRHDAAVARGVLDRAHERTQTPAPALLPPPRPVPPSAPEQALGEIPSEVPGEEALTSIFRYEKRNGRLRRVAASDKSDG